MTSRHKFPSGSKEAKAYKNILVRTKREKGRGKEEGRECSGNERKLLPLSLVLERSTTTTSCRNCTRTSSTSTRSRPHALSSTSQSMPSTLVRLLYHSIIIRPKEQRHTCSNVVVLRLCLTFASPRCLSLYRHAGHEGPCAERHGPQGRGGRGREALAQGRYPLIALLARLWYHQSQQPQL